MPFNDIWHKVSAAEEDVRTLKRELGKYREEYFEFHVSFEAEVGSYRGYFGALNPPNRVRHLLGQVAGTLRSAFDFLARELVLLNGGVPKDGPGGTMFPIRTNEARIEVVGGISDLALAMISGLQPGRSPSPTRQPLALLSELASAHKHRHLPEVAYLGTIYGFAGSNRIIEKFGMFEDGTEVFNQSTNPFSDPKVKVHFEFAPDIAISERHGGPPFVPADEVMSTLVSFVRQLVGGFEAIFFSKDRFPWLAPR